MTEVKTYAAADLLTAVTQVLRLEGAPVPVTGNRGSDLAGLGRLGVLQVLGFGD